MIAAAEAAVLHATQQWQELCRKEAAAFTREEELRLATISREAVRLAWRAVEGQLFPTAGSSSVRAGERIERVWRDLSTLHSHAGNGVFLSSLANRELAQAHFAAAGR
jgi:3-hydroxy-9,10-secoandrosta-1,3,5(10)-triene-9,17-dione monooxygenase